jgi:hypothetical protein
MRGVKHRFLKVLRKTSSSSGIIFVLGFRIFFEIMDMFIKVLRVFCVKLD